MHIHLIFNGSNSYRWSENWMQVTYVFGGILFFAWLSIALPGFYTCFPFCNAMLLFAD